MNLAMQPRPSSNAGFAAIYGQRLATWRGSYAFK